MKHSSLIAALVLAWGLCTCPLSTRADAPALHWVRAQGAEACIDPIALARRVEALTGPVFVAPASAQLSLAGEIAPDSKGFRMRLVLSGRDGRVRGERVLRGRDPDCHKLDAALAFVIALTLDPSLSLADAPAEVLASFAQELPPEETLLAELSREPAPVVAQEKARDAESTRPVAVQAAQAASVDHAPALRRSRARYMAALGASALGFVLPSFAPGAQVALGVRPVRWLLVSASLKLAFSMGAQAVPREGHATFRALELELSGCPSLFSSGPFLLSACIGAALAQLSARGSDFTFNRAVQLWAPALYGRLLAWLHLPKNAALWAELGARLRLVEQRFTYLASDRSMRLGHQPQRVGLQLALGAGYVF